MPAFLAEHFVGQVEHLDIGPDTEGRAQVRQVVEKRRQLAVEADRHDVAAALEGVLTKLCFQRGSATRP